MQTSIPRYQDATHSSPSSVSATDSLTTNSSHAESKIGDFLGTKIYEGSSSTGEVKRLVSQIEEKLNRQKVNQQIVKGTPRIYPGYPVSNDLDVTINPWHSNIADFYSEDSKVLDSNNPSRSHSQDASDASEIDPDGLTMENIYTEDPEITPRTNPLKNPNESESTHFTIGSLKRGNLVIGEKEYPRESLNPDISY